MELDNNYTLADLTSVSLTYSAEITDLNTRIGPGLYPEEQDLAERREDLRNRVKEINDRISGALDA